MESNSTLSIRLGADLKRKWASHCQKNGTTPSAGVKDTIRFLIGNKPNEISITTTVFEVPDSSRRRMEIRVTGSEFEKISSFAADQEVSPNQWVINLIRANLTAQPQLGMKELRVLGESNSRLLAIGRNLNQIARRTNADASEHALLKIEHIEKIFGFIKGHTETVSRLMRDNIDRWVLK